MAAGSDLLDEVFLNAEVDEKVVSDLVGSLESQLAASGHHRGHHRPPEGLRAAATAAAGQLLGNHVVSGGGGSSSPSPGGGGGGGGGGNASAQTGSPGTTTTTTTSSSSSSSSAAATTTANNAAAKMGLSGPETTKPGAGGVQGSVINHNARSQGSTLDGATTTSVSTTTNVQGGSEAAVTPGTLNQGKSVVISTMATALSTRNGKIGSTTVQTLNGSNVVMNSHTSFTATPATANPAIVPAVTPLVNNGPGNVGKVSTVNALLPSASNTVIQTSFLGTGVSSASSPSPTVISSQQPPGLGTGGPTVALVRPPIHAAGPSVAAATQNGSNTVINSTISVGSFPAAAVAAATVGSGVSLQTSLVNSQPGSGVPTAPTTQVIKSESPKTIVQTVTQQQTLAAGGQPSTTGGNMIIGQTMQAGLPNVAPNPGGVPPAPGTPTGLVKGAANTVTQSLPRTPAATTSGIRATLTPTVLAPRQPPQNPTNIQNFQLPPGMVLVRSENGQLLMIPQHALAQMQAQAHAQSQSQATMTPRPATPTSASPVQLSTVQAPGTPIIARQVAPTTIIKQVSQAQTTVQPTTTLQRPPVVQPQIVLGSPAQTTTLGTASAVQTGTPQRTVQGATATSTVATETMENVKKCKNFLSTLIKLASSGKQSTETAANVKELVQNLLDGKIEAEDFTSRLYRELNSSPQPYLVPFLKRSLPALRQLTPDSAAFIQQSQHQQPTTQPTTALTAVMLSGSVQRTAGKTTATVTSTLQQPVISLTQPTQVGVGKQGQPTQVVIQQSQKPGTLIRPPQVTLTQTPMVALRPPHNRIMLTAPQQIQLNPLQTVPVVKQTVLPGTKALSTLSSQAAAAQKNKLKEPGGGSFRDDDDINDVASMAGVNLSEESARILATNSELVGTLTRSCKDETFLLPAPLQRRILEIGKKHGITEIHPDVVSYVSHATQQRLQTLVEKVSETAQQKNLSYKDDERYDQASDVRAQLKFFEQLDQIEKQRKDEQEREILMRAAKSRSRQEDPEQLRLKQKAKEMQQQELAQMRQRDANLTALAAIGPRKKRKVESPGAGSGTEGSSTSIAVPGSSGVGTTRQFTRQRITRVNLRDLIFCLENERETSHSLLLYKAFLK
ncbi:transcription initiation factor TFIID subunit 4 isoform X2 [Anolis carolinensis]|uniref:transcription initiation factor TFIID subunit 4 isoform X2 n=1 Tax=Anolis carolinensis TaxID=28377 RepID=UPI000462E31E|nr:PREDICTED: transcription initiation factor TFIID subunit 4 isoform X2 [Anolis carolinensis]|eukprot:XP_008108359.1 PREDICTED: transcription initiation factor TFIID subunit 4 isoform X2 [Anolis carolinensis]